MSISLGKKVVSYTEEERTRRILIHSPKKGELDHGLVSDEPHWTATRDIIQTYEDGTFNVVKDAASTTRKLSEVADQVYKNKAGKTVTGLELAEFLQIASDTARQEDIEDEKARVAKLAEPETKAAEADKA